MTLEEVKKTFESLLPLNEGEKIESIIMYKSVEVPGKGLVKELKDTPAQIVKTRKILCEVGLNYGMTKYAAFKQEQRQKLVESGEAAEKKPRANNKVWDIKDILSTNSRTKNTNLEVYVDKSDKWILETAYEVTYADGTTEIMPKLSDKALSMRKAVPEEVPEKTATGEPVYMPLLTIGIDKILSIQAAKQIGKYKTAK